MTDTAAELELNKPSSASAGFQQWADVFYGVLVAPGQTMSVLADSSQYKSDGMAFVLAVTTVVSSSIVAGVGASGGDTGALATGHRVLYAFRGSYLERIVIFVIRPFTSVSLA